MRNTGFGANPKIKTTALVNQMRKKYQPHNGVAAAGRIWQWNTMATICLKDIAELL